MSDKMVTAVYGTLSICVWSCTMALLIFIIALFCTGRYQSPAFTLKAVAVSAADNNDPELNARSLTSDGWYRAVFDVNITGAKLSPYTYTANGVAFNAPEDIKYSMEYFLSAPDSIEYSVLSPCDFTLTLYIKCGSSEKACDIASRSAFGLRGLKQNFAFFYKELVMNLPGFSVSDFDVEPVTV